MLAGVLSFTYEDKTYISLMLMLIVITCLNIFEENISEVGRQETQEQKAGKIRMG